MRPGGLWLLALGAAMGAGPATADEALRQQVDALERRLAAVEARHGDPLSPRRAAEIRELVADVLSDADARASLAPGPSVAAGYDHGAVFVSLDGDWMLRANLVLQTRFEMNSARGMGPAAEDTLWGFEVTRAKFLLSGTVVSPQWSYRLAIETSRNAAAGVVNAAGMAVRTDFRFGLQTAYVRYDLGNKWKVFWGTRRAPLLYEDLVDSRYQQAVERSVVNYLYTGGDVDGLGLEYEWGGVRVVTMVDNGVSDGLYGGAVPGGPGPALVSNVDFAITGRGEWRSAGTWEQMDEYTSPRGEEPAVLLGLAGHYQTGAGILGGTELLVLTADASVHLGGGNVYGAVIWTNAQATGPTANSLGALIGGGYYLSDDWEVFGRYEWSDPDLAGISNISILTVGVTRYFDGQHVKWSTDVGVGLDEISLGVPVTGFRADAPGEDGQVVVRSQLQVVF